MNQRNYNHIIFIISIILMMIFGVSCGDRIVTKCSQLDGTYWKSCSSNDSLYVPHVIRFEDDKIYSGQTGNYMTYNCDEKEGIVEDIASFKIVDGGKLSMKIMTRKIPFLQITEDEYVSILEKHKNKSNKEL